MKNFRVSFQGEPGAFSEQAALAYFGTSCAVIARESFFDIFSDVTSHTSDFAVVPIENSLFGSVHQNYDLLQKFNVFIAGEITLRVVMNLLALPGVPLKNIREVYSHPQALGQSEEFLRKLKNVTIHPYYDTAGAAKMIASEHRTDAAAIASARAAKHYHLHMLHTGIETDRQNFTRFLIITRKPAEPKREAKTSIIFATKNIPGSLFHSLAVFALRNINLLKIESRPMVGTPWEYLFYLDIQADARQKECVNALRHLQELTTYFKNLGSYEIGRTISDLKL
ncbi:MAG: prephenate dehydratase [Bacteroidota bacterium]|nr:prephenate dehydratase [Bacteroidota bacterium]